MHHNTWRPSNREISHLINDCDLNAATTHNVHQKITEITNNYQPNPITTHILKLTDPNSNSNCESTQQIQRKIQCHLARILARFITQCLNTRTECGQKTNPEWHDFQHRLNLSPRALMSQRYCTDQTLLISASIHLYSLVFTCIHLHSLVFTCIHLYSLVRSCDGVLVKLLLYHVTYDV